MAVAKKNEQTTAVTQSQANVPATDAAYAGYEQYAGQGLDDVTSEDKGLPFYEVLQPLSPEVEDIEGAKPGMIINKATKELFEQIRFVPVCREHVYCEWIPRDNGGGLVATYQLTDPVVTKARQVARVGKVELENGNELIETFYLYGFVLDAEDTPTAAVIAFTSTKIGAYKTLTTRSDSLMFRTADGRKLKYPWFAHVWKLGTEKKKKDKYLWYVWTVAFDGPNDRAEEARLPADGPIAPLASDLLASQRSGSIKVNTEGLSNESGTAGVDKGAKSSGRSAEDMDDPPF